MRFFLVAGYVATNGGLKGLGEAMKLNLALGESASWFRNEDPFAKALADAQESSVKLNLAHSHGQYNSPDNPCRTTQALEKAQMKVNLATTDETLKWNFPRGEADTINGYLKGSDVPNLRILVSYHYYKDEDLRGLFEQYFKETMPEIFMDSGAYSAATQKTTIDIAAYADYLDKYKDMLSVLAGLDVIGDAEATYKNQQYLMKRGLDVLPTFHVGEDFSWLERYISDGHKYIALGGMVPYSMQRGKLFHWLSQCYAIFDRQWAAGKPVVFHGFGMTSWDLIKAFPWYSVDSSSWTAGFRFGRVPLFDEKLGKFQVVALRDVTGSFAYSDLIREFGYTPNDLCVDSQYDRGKIATISALSYVKAEAWLTRMWKKHGYDFNGIALVAIPPKPGSELNPDSRFVGGTQQFEAFSKIQEGTLG